MFKLTTIIANGTTAVLTNVNLNYTSDGDSNDIFYFIGTVNNTTTFTNPQSIANAISIQVNTLSNGTLLNLTDRSVNGLATTDVANSNVTINLGSNRTLLLNKYSIRSRNIGSTYIRNWKLQGSNDNSTWVDLDTQTNNATITAASGWVSITVTGLTVAYQYFKLVQNGLNASSTNVLNLGELQLYGNYSYYN